MIHRTETHIDEDWFRDLMAGAHPHEKAKLVYHAFCALVDVEQVEQDECTDWLAQHLTGHDSAATFLEVADKLKAASRVRQNPDLQNLRPGQHVRFHPIIGGKHDGNTYVVRHANGDGVWLEGKPGMVAWSSVTPIESLAQQRKEVWECPQCGSSQWEADGSPECKTIWCADGCGFHTNPGDATYPAAPQRKEGGEL